MFGFLLAAFGISATAKTVADYTTVSCTNRQQRQAFQDTLNAGQARMRRFAEAHDLCSSNTNFYSDGSLFKDWITNKVYKKGQYYCNCEGWDVNLHQNPDRSKWAPDF